VAQTRFDDRGRVLANWRNPECHRCFLPIDADSPIAADDEEGLWAHWACIHGDTITSLEIRASGRGLAVQAVSAMVRHVEKQRDAVENPSERDVYDRHVKALEDIVADLAYRWDKPAARLAELASQARGTS